MPDAGRYVCRCARDAHAQITQLFDFVSPTAIALWNLRWQVQGFLQQVPDATSEDLSSRFASKSGMRGGELRRACVATAWSDQLSEFASFVLITLVAIFEDYVSRLADFAPQKDRERILKALQFPTSNKGGRDWGLKKLNTAAPSISNVFNVTKQGSKYAGKKIDNLLVCYRYFKELRNSIAHNGGRATKNAETAYTAFAAIANVSHLGVTEVPKHFPVVENQKIKLDFRGVTGLGDVILRIITTYDADLSSSKLAETEILARAIPVPKAQQFFKARKAGDRTAKIQNTIYAGGMPKPNLTPTFEIFLKHHKIIPAFW